MIVEKISWFKKCLYENHIEIVLIDYPLFQTQTQMLYSRLGSNFEWVAKFELVHAWVLFKISSSHLQIDS